MSSVIHFGTNIGFAKYVWSAEAALDIARRELGLNIVELVADNDFGPAFHILDRRAFLNHHRAIGEYARSQGMLIPSVFTFYRDGGGVAHPKPGIQSAAEQALRSLADQAAAVGAPYPCAALMSADRDTFEREPTACRERALGAWTRWMSYAHSVGLRGLLLEMSAQEREDCATIAGTRATLQWLQDYHQAHPDTTVPVELCYDVGHGISRDEASDDAERDFRCWFTAFPAAIREVHLKNTDAEFLTTWPFTPAYEKTGIIRPREVVAAVRDILQGEVYLMLEISGKRGREIGERQILEDLRITAATWKDALEAEGFREDAAGSWKIPD